MIDKPAVYEKCKECDKTEMVQEPVLRCDTCNGVIQSEAMVKNMINYIMNGMGKKSFGAERPKYQVFWNKECKVDGHEGSSFEFCSPVCMNKFVENELAQESGLETCVTITYRTGRGMK